MSDTTDGEVVSLDAFRRKARLDTEEVFEVDRWGVCLSLAIPEQPRRHPRYLDGIARHVGRSCAIDTEYAEGVSMSFNVAADTREEAEADTRAVAHLVLDLLGLDEAAVMEFVVEDVYEMYDVAPDGTFEIAGSIFRLKEREADSDGSPDL
jgi:hypothetical protein